MKNKEKGVDGSNINALLQKIREQMVHEFLKYKKDTEEAVNKTIAEMRERLEQRAKEKLVLEEERDRLLALLAKLQGQINELEGQVGNYTIGTAITGLWL